MSLYDKAIKNVAEAAARIMIEKLHPNQQVLDVHEPEKDKLTSQDFKKLRSMKKEDVKQVEEAKFDPLKNIKNPSPAVKAAAKDVKRGSYADRAALMKAGGVKDDRGPRGVTQEEVDEAVESPFTSYKKPREIESRGGSGIKKGTAYGGSAQKSKPEQETAEEKPMKPKKKKISEMVAMYNEKGLKSLEEMTKVELSEEPDNEQFTKEVEDQKASMSGKKKSPSVAAPATQGVKNMPEEVESIDDINGVKIDTIEERSLSEPEMKKKEEIVKSMKKGLQGFKDRYGDDAKSVMYATATKQAKGE